MKLKLENKPLITCDSGIRKLKRKTEKKSATYEPSIDSSSSFTSPNNCREREGERERERGGEGGRKKEREAERERVSKRN